MFAYGTLIIILIVVGIVAGIVSTAAGLASLVSYPVLLALGLPPVTANVTNTVGLVLRVLAPYQRRGVNYEGTAASSKFYYH